jgi:hypothetical protein
MNSHYEAGHPRRQDVCSFVPKPMQRWGWQVPVVSSIDGQPRHHADRFVG